MFQLISCNNNNNSSYIWQQLNILKRTLSGLEVQLSQQRSHNTQTKRDVMERDGKIQGLQLNNDNLLKKQEEVNKNLWDAGQRYKHMEKLVQVWI